MDSLEDQDPNVLLLVAATTTMAAAMMCMMVGAWMLSTGRCAHAAREDEEHSVQPEPAPPPPSRQWSGVALVRQPDGGGALGVPAWPRKFSVAV